MCIVYIYIYIYRERERKRYIHTYIQRWRLNPIQTYSVRG